MSTIYLISGVVILTLFYYHYKSRRLHKKQINPEIQNQIIQNRATNMDATFGQIGYSYSSIKNNAKTINTALKTNQYKYKSFAPPIFGKDAIYPNAPVNIRFLNTKLSWDTPSVASDGDLPVKYVIYAFDSAAEAITNKDDGSKILDIISGNELIVAQNLIDTKYFVVSSLDKNNNETGDFNSTLGNSNFNSLTSISLKAYPNPFTYQFEVEFPEAFYNSVNVSIYESSGKKVFDNIYVIKNSKILITAENMSKGIYFVKVIFVNGTTKSFKIIKQ